MKINIYIKGERLDLYQDENIFYENKLKDMTDISAVFSDFTNTFTLPANENNNRIFDNWFEINYDLGVSFNAQKRVDAYIETDTVPYRFGVIQLEGVTTEKNIPTFYSITFYSETTALDDLFDEDELSNIVGSHLDFSWNNTNVINLMSEYSYDVENLQGQPLQNKLIIPMIFPNEGDINYLGGGQGDISTSVNAIPMKSFRPSIQVYELIKSIENTYGLDFRGDFFQKPEFQNLYMHLNRNIEEGFGKRSTVTVNPQTEINATRPLVDDLIDYSNNEYSANINMDYELIENTFNYLEEVRNVEVSSYVNISTNDTPNYDVRLINLDTGEVYWEGSSDDNGEVVSDYHTLSYRSYTSGNIPPNNSFNVAVQIRADEEIELNNIDFFIQVRTNGNYLSDLDGRVAFLRYEGDYEYLPDFIVADNLPELSVGDFFKDIIKLFNLVIRPINATTFQIESYRDYIQEGNTIDITKYVDIDKIKSERKEVNKKINYLYQESDVQMNILQKGGSQRYTFDVDTKEEEEIEFEFELATFSRLLSQDEDVQSNINIYLLQDAAGEPVYPDTPLIHYYNGVVDVDDNGGSIFINEGNVDYSLNKISLCDTADNEITAQVNNDLSFRQVVGSNWHSNNELISVNQFNNYFAPFLNNIYASNNRVVDFNVKLPFNLIEKIDLNTRLIYQNNQFLIDDMKINLLNGDASIKCYVENNNRYKVIENGIETLGSVNTNVNLYYNVGGHRDGFYVISDEPFSVSTQSTTGGLILDEISYSAGRHYIQFEILPNTEGLNLQYVIDINRDSGNYTAVLNQRT